MKYKYDSESDVLSIPSKKVLLSIKKEAGDFVLHYDSKDISVYLEILPAHHFLSNAMKTLPKKVVSQALSS